jgi:hypothetical protein
LPEDRVLVVPYDDLRHNPARALVLLHERLGLPLHAAAMAERARGPQASPSGAARYVSRHRYSLEEFGLHEHELRAALGPVFERYGF